MSEQTVVPEENAQATKPKRTRNERVEFSKVIARAARKLDTDETTAGKKVRTYARAHFDEVSKMDPSYFGKNGKHKERANDGRPWVSVNTRLADALVNRTLGKKS